MRIQVPCGTRSCELTVDSCVSVCQRVPLLYLHVTVCTILLSLSSVPVLLCRVSTDRSAHVCLCSTAYSCICSPGFFTLQTEMGCHLRDAECVRSNYFRCGIQHRSLIIPFAYYDQLYTPLSYATILYTKGRPTRLE